MRSELDIILKKKGFKSPEGVTNFGAIPLNQIPTTKIQLKETILGVYIGQFQTKRKRSSKRYTN